MHAVACLDSGLLWTAVSSNAQNLHYERIIQTCFHYLHWEAGKTSLNLLIGQQSHCTPFIQCPAVKKFTPCLVGTVPINSKQGISLRASLRYLSPGIHNKCHSGPWLLRYLTFWWEFKVRYLPKHNTNHPFE